MMEKSRRLLEDYLCEYCGCQALTTIDELTREHDAVVALISEVIEGTR